MQALFLFCALLVLAIELVCIPYAFAGYAWAWWVVGVIGVSCIGFLVWSHITTRRNQARMEREKKEVFADFKARGFKSTHQYKVSGQLFAIDENSRQWFVMRYADPKSTRLHSFDEIRGYERRENTQTQTLGTGIAATSWLGVASFTSQKVYTKLGVMVMLNDVKHPTEYISCMGNEDGVDEVMNILDIIKEKA